MPQRVYAAAVHAAARGGDLMPRKLTAQEMSGSTLGHLEYTPLTFWQKVGDFFTDHWKIVLILALALIGVVVLFAEMSKEPVPDAKVIFISSSYVLPKDTVNKLQSLLVPYTKDVNKDSAQFTKVYACYYDKDQTGANAEEAALTGQLLADDTCYVIFADPDAYAWLVENGYVSKLGAFKTNRPDIEPDSLGFSVSDSNIFGYVKNGPIGFAGDDYGLSNAFADYHIAFKTGAYDELTGGALIAYQTAGDFYQAVMSTIITTSAVTSAQ
jgi:hypothetical protein